MKVTIQRSALLKPLQMISGIVEKRQTHPILANVLIKTTEQGLLLTGTDMEIELVGNAPIVELSEPGTITVSARKLLDICRALPEESIVQLILEGDQLILRSGRSRFLLTTLPAEDFPHTEESPFHSEFSISQTALKTLMNKVYFAMGQQDVRHYLNGILFDINQGVMQCIATDGHRLAFSTLPNEIQANDVKTKIILPRKSVLELMRLLDANDENIAVFIGDNHFRAKTADFIFTSKLINAQIPDYNKLIPRSAENTVIASREALKQALTRASILLSSEKFRGIRLHLEQDHLRIVANNPEQEEAEEIIPIEYQGNSIEIGFNVSYLLDVVSAIASPHVRWLFSNPDKGILMEPTEQDNALYVVMPMRL